MKLLDPMKMVEYRMQKETRKTAKIGLKQSKVELKKYKWEKISEDSDTLAIQLIGRWLCIGVIGLIFVLTAFLSIDGMLKNGQNTSYDKVCMQVAAAAATKTIDCENLTVNK